MLLLGLDLGATWVKGAVLDLDTLTLRAIRRMPFPPFLPGLPAAFREVDPEAVTATVRAMLAELLREAPDCAGIVMCGQMHGVILTDGAGQAKSHFISWQDQRVLQPYPGGEHTHYAEIVARLSAAERLRLGNELRPGMPIGTLFWLAENAPETLRESLPLSLTDYVLAQLCAAVPQTGLTNAAAHGLVNLETRAWDMEVANKLGLDGCRWPHIAPAGGVVGVAELDGRRLPCYLAVGDQQCALTGALLAETELSLNIATGSQVSRLCSTLTFGDYQTRPFADDRWLRTITHIPAGRALNALIRLLTELGGDSAAEFSAATWQAIEEAVARVPATELRADIAFFPSALGDSGSLSHLTEENLTIGHLFRAVFERMGDQYASCAARIDPQQTWQRLVFSGGLVRKSPALRQAILSRFAGDARYAPEEDCLFGLLVLGAVYTGRFPTVEEAIRLMAAAGQPSGEGLAS